MTLVRVLAIVAAIVAVVLFILYGSTANAHDLAYSLVAVAAAIGLIAIDPVVPVK
jgi:hypothetical protein